VGDSVAIDAGAITSSLSLGEQERIRSVLVSHPHMDHVRDLATLADNRCQQGGSTLDIVGIPATIEALRNHFFNDVLWPDFTRIDTKEGPTVRFVEVQANEPATIDGYEIIPVLVNHTVDTSAFIIRHNATSIVYGGDTGPTEELWRRVNALRDLQAVMMEVSFPDRESELARQSKHLTPRTLALELDKLEHGPELPILLYHIKPTFESEVLRELAQLRGRNLQILEIDDEFLL
jgi:3',5'-cyclic-nucleotide phosphodiesterase